MTSHRVGNRDHMNNIIRKNSVTLLCIAAAALAPSHPAHAAGTTFKPFVGVAEEFTDNVFELPANKRWEVITRARPGATFSYQSPFWTWDTSYTFEYRNYARNSKADEFNHDGALKGTIALVDNLLYLDLADTYKRVSLDVARNAATESSLFLNQTDQNVATVSPYIRWRLRGDNTLRTGYRFTDTRYWDTTSIDKREHQGFLELTHELTSKISISTGYTFNRLESKPSRYNKHDAFGGFRYEYAEKSFLSGQVGNSWQIFTNGSNVNYLFWNAGLTHDFRTFVVTLETKVATTEDPLAVSTRETGYSGKIERTFERGGIAALASFTEYANTATNRVDREKLAISTNGRYEVFQDLTMNLSVGGERFTRKVDTDYGYRLTGSAGLSQAFKNELLLALTYSYVTERRTLESSVGAKEINKVVVELKKTF